MMLRLLLAAFLALASAGAGAALVGDTLIDFENGSEGATVTGTIVSNGTKGNQYGGFVTLTDPAGQSVGSTPSLTITSSASYRLPGSATINGSVITDAGTRGMRATMSTDAAVQMSFTNPGYQLSVGFFFRFNGPQINYSPRDVFGLRSDYSGNYQFLQLNDNPAGPYFHAHWQPYSSGSGVGSDVTFTRNKWYWVTMRHVAGGGTTEVRFYDPATGYALVGSSTGDVSSGSLGVTHIQFGSINYASGGTQSVDFDNIVINTSGTFPLLPVPSLTDYMEAPSGSSGKRTIDWSAVGIPGGIPARTTNCATLSAGATNAQIQSALNSCGSGQTVKLGAGTYNITGQLVIPSNVTLRGSGPQSTILNVTGSGNGAVQFGSGSTPGATGANITSGATVGSTSIVVSSASGMSVGGRLMITRTNGTAILSETNETPYVTNTTGNGACTWCDAWSGTRAQGQIVEITSVAGTTITFTPALYITYDTSPLATVVPSGAEWAGAEDLQVYANDTSPYYVANFYLQSTRYCWIKNVESNYTKGDHVEIHFGYRNEVRDSYFHDGFDHAAGNDEITVFLANKTSGTLVENNLLRRLMSSVILNWGAAGNVIAYNYSERAFNTTGYNTLFGKIGTHGAHPQFNLVEGNWTSNIDWDYFWGSSSHNTAFRNRFTGKGEICQPLSGRGTENSCYQASQALFAADLSQTVRFATLAGNVYGTSGSSPWTPSRVAPSQSRSYYTSNNYYGFAFGYANLTDDGSETNDSALPNTTAILHGNRDAVNASWSWNASLDQALPASLYLSAKPAWFGASLAWPAFGPDMTTPTTAVIGDIPARWCWQNGGQMPSCLASSGLLPAPTNLHWQRL